MRFFSKVVLVLLLGVYSSSSLLVAQEQKVRERVNLKLQDIKIADFIKMVGKVTGENILLTQPVPGTFNFVSSAPIYKDELMDILLAVLGKKGFTIVQDGSFLKVERASTAIKRNLPIGESKSGLMKTVFIEPKNENVDVLAAKVRQFLSEGGKLLTIKESNTMILSDFPDNIDVIQKVVDKIESQRAASMHVKFIELKYAKASRLASQVLKISQAIINQKVQNNKVEIMSDDATNSIIILASKQNIKKLENVISNMDAKDDSGLQKLEIIPLENSEAKNVVTSLQQVLDKKQYTKPADKPTVGVYDELNALIVSGFSEDINSIKAMVKILDVEKPQVFVRARIIEINQNKTDSLGIKYGLGGGALTDGGLFTFAANLGGTALAFDPSKVMKMSGVTANAGIIFGATIDFLASNGAAKTLSEPTLLCVNNQESSIYVGRTEPVISSSQQGSATTSLSRNTYTRQDIGLTLKIKPRLSSGDKVTLITTTKLEDIVNSSIPGLPSTTKREVLTTAIVNNGESVIIGGLIYSKDTDEAQGIPLLRDIPILGYLFDSKRESSTQINLVIILTPYIVRNSEDMKEVKQMLKELDNVQHHYRSLIADKLEERREELGLDEKESTKSIDDELTIITPEK